MNDIPSNQLLEDLPTQNEIMQSNNDSQTPTDFNPPPLNDNNIPQQPLDNQQTTTNYIPPKIYDNNIPQQPLDNNNYQQTTVNYTPPPVYDSNAIQEYPKPSEDVPSQNVPVQYAPFPEQNQNQPNTIYQSVNVPDPLSQNFNNYQTQSNTNPNNPNIYDNQIYLPTNIPTPEPAEVKQEELKVEVPEPVYQLQVVPAPQSNQIQNTNQNVKYEESCCDCCLDCMKDFCDGCCRDCEKCCENIDWAAIICCCFVLLCKLLEGLCK